MRKGLSSAFTLDMLLGMYETKTRLEARSYWYLGGVGGIRTLGTGEPVRRISNPVHSTTLPPLRSVEDRILSEAVQGFRGVSTAALRGAMVR